MKWLKPLEINDKKIVKNSKKEKYNI